MIYTPINPIYAICNWCLRGGGGAEMHGHVSITVCKTQDARSQIQLITAEKIGNSRNTPYDKDMNFFNIFINNGPICMGFEADREEKVQKLAYLIKFSEKCLIIKYEQRLKY